jgi:hypothetical protein
MTKNLKQFRYLDRKLILSRKIIKNGYFELKNNF